MGRPSTIVVLAALAAACTTPAPPPRPVAADALAAPAPPPPRPVLLLARARVLRDEGDAAGARERLEAAIEAAPGDPEVRIELADLLVADGRELARAGALLAGLEGGARLHLVRARLAEATGDDASAAWEYGIVLAAEDDPELRLRRALALERLGHPDATEELERVRAARPDDAVARSRLAERYEASGRLAEAEAEYRWLAEAQPDRPAPWERLSRFYERNGRGNEAHAAAERGRTVTGRPERSLRPLLPSRR